MTVSLQELSCDILTQHICPFLDAVSLARLGQSCRYTNQLIGGSQCQAIWKRRHYERWMFSQPTMFEEEAEKTLDSDWKRRYKQRIELDRLGLRRFRLYCANNNERRDLRMKKENNISKNGDNTVTANDGPNLNTSAASFSLADSQDLCIFLYKNRLNVKDLLLALADCNESWTDPIDNPDAPQLSAQLTYSSKEYKEYLEQWSTVKCSVSESKIARILLQCHHFSFCTEEWERLNKEATLQSTTNTRLNNASPYGGLMDGAILIAWAYHGAMHPESNYGSFVAGIEKRLESFGDVLKQSLKVDSISEGPRYVNEVLSRMAHFFRGVTRGDEQAVSSPDLNDYCDFFQGNVVFYYSLYNSLIDHVLMTGKGIPISLSTVYASIIESTTSLKVHSISLPGHFVLGISTGDDINGSMVYVDAFYGGRILTAEDCQRIVQSHDLPWSDFFLHPVPNVLVWQRMARNLIPLVEQVLRSGKSPEMAGYSRFLSVLDKEIVFSSEEVMVRSYYNHITYQSLGSAHVVRLAR
jgi:Transglutaminase-like superfamily